MSDFKYPHTYDQILLIVNYLDGIEKSVKEMFNTQIKEKFNYRSDFTYHYYDSNGSIHTRTFWSNIEYFKSECMKGEINSGSNGWMSVKNSFVMSRQMFINHEIRITAPSNIWEGYQADKGLTALKGLGDNYTKMAKSANSAIDAITKLHDKLPYLRMKGWGVDKSSIGFYIRLRTVIPGKLLKRIIKKRTLVDDLNEGKLFDNQGI